MKSLVVALLLLSGVCFADSVDTFSLAMPSSTWTWSLPASPTPSSADSGGFTLSPVPVVTGVIPPSGSTTIDFHIFFASSGTQMIMGCSTFWFNSFFCDIIAGAGSNAPMFSGSPYAPTFIPGTYGGLTITQASSDPVPVPEGSAFAMLGIAGLVMFGGLKTRNALARKPSAV